MKKIQKKVQLLLPISILIVLVSTMLMIATITDQKVSAKSFSPTGWCKRGATTTCIPCDPGLPGGRDMCVPSSQVPGGGFASNTGHGSKANPPTNNNNPSTLAQSTP